MDSSTVITVSFLALVVGVLVLIAGVGLQELVVIFGGTLILMLSAIGLAFGGSLVPTSATETH